MVRSLYQGAGRDYGLLQAAASLTGAYLAFCWQYFVMVLDRHIHMIFIVHAFTTHLVLP